MMMWRTTAMLAATAAASLLGAQALQRPVDEVGDEVLTRASVCARAARTGWFPVIVPGCKEALASEGFGTYDVPGAFRHADCYSAPVEVINDLMEGSEMKIDFPDKDKTMYVRLVDEDLNLRNFSNVSHIFQWKWDALGEYLGPCGHESQNEEYYWLFSKSSNYALENCESGNYESGINANGFFSNDWNTDTSFWADTIGWDSGVVISINVEDYCANEVVFTYEAQEVGFCGDDDTNRLCSVEYNGGLLPANDTTCLHVEGHYQGGSWVVDSESGEWTLDDCDLRCTELICAADIMCGGYTYFKETGVVRLASVIDYTEAAGGTYCMQKIGSPTVLVGDGGACRLNETYASLDARDFDDYPGLVKTDAQGLPNVDACNNLCFTYAWCKSFAFSEDLSKCLLYDWVPEALSTIRSENSYSCYTYSEYVPEATLPPAAKTCQDDIDGGGWSLVRRVKQGRKWHPATDHLTGTAVYGTFVNDGSVGETFSRYYASELEGDTEFLFSSGDCYYWLISDETNVVYRRGAPFMANILAASDIQKEHEVLWYHRSTHAEDPWISLQDHEDSIYSATVLYGENDWYGDSRDTLLADHNGANVYIRPGKRTPAPGTDELEVPAPYGTRALSPPAPAQAKPQYQLPAPQGGKTSCCAVFLGPNSGNTGEYEVRVDVDGAPPGQEHVAASLQHKAKAGKYVIRAQVYRTDDWDGSSNLLHSRVFGTDNAAIASTNGPAVAASNHWEYYEATLDTGSKVPGWFSIYLGFPMENEDGYTYISQLTLTDEDGFQWVPNNGDADCELGIIEGVAGNNSIDSSGNIGVTEVPCDFDVIPAPEVVTDLCEVRHGPWAGGSPTDAYCSWYEVRADVMCRDKIWLGKDKTLPECWQAIEEDDRCSDTMYGDGSTSCACVPKDSVCTYAVSTVGNAVYERCCEVRTVAASCWNNCGRYTPDRSCFCTHDCAAVGDCCDDFQELCCAPAPEHAGAIDLDAPAPDTDDTAPAQMLLAPRASPTPSPIIEVDQTTKFSAQLANPSPAAQTCKGNCQWPWTGGSNTATASCYCDKDCDAYNDCCDDKPTWCRNGCTNQACRNYDPAALVDDGGCYQCDQKTIPAPKIPDRTPSPINPSPSSVFPAPANRTPSPTPAPGRRQQDWPFDWKPAPDKQANQHNDADATMTCVGNCYAPWHSDSKQACWCDESCEKFEDCCDDKEDACPSTPAQNPAPHPGPHGANVVPSPTPGPDTDANNYTDHHPSPTPAPQQDSAGDIAEMPAPFGTDPVTSCEGYCDYPYHSSIPNSCWCDVYCIEHGDCCDDREICISDCEKEITAIYERVLCRKPDTEEIVDLLDACIAPGENVAATKADCRPSSVASTDNKCEAALDGKRNTAFRTKSATPNPVTACDVDAEEDPFLEFDMSVENGIGVVTIKNVLDSCASRLFAHSGKCEWSMDANKYDAFNEGAVVGISQNPCEVGKGCQGIICDKLDTPNEYGNYEVDCGGQFGRYVWIYLPGACRVLSLAEITVEVPDTGIGMWYKEQFNENGIEGFCEDHTTNYLCANGVYEYLNGGFAPTNPDTCDLANAVGVWDSFSCGNECAQELCSVDGNCNGYVWEKSGNIRLVNRVAGVGKQEGSHCYKQSNALGNKGKKTFPLIEYELLNSEEYEDCDWCQAQCDADPQDCVGAWGEWGDCSASCGEGTATRYFLITQQAYSGGDECEYKKYTEETTDCETGVLVDGELKCPLDCEGDWDDWTDCSVSCGGGTQSRMFNVTVAADYGGNSCEDIFDLDVEDVGDTATETATCADTYCPSDCSGEWSDYSVCPVTCGAEDNLFTSTRTYEILIPARLGGEECPEFDGVVESGTGLCNTNQCAIDITIWVDEDLNEYLINDAKSEWVTDDGYVEGAIDFYDEDPAILYNGDGDVVAAVHMVQVTENEVDTHGLRVAVDDNEEELDAMYAEFDNTMELDDSNVVAGLHNVILGGYSNDLEPETEYCSIGAGKHNQALDKSSYAAMGGGLNNVINANYASVLGGWKNKCYSNYCVVVGGFLNQVSARFGTVLGGAKNTVAGRFGVAAGYQATTKGDWSATFAFNNSACVNEDDSTVKFCANSFVVNDFDVVDLFPTDSRRALRGEGEDRGDDDAKRLRGSETDRDDDDDDDDELEVSERAAECADRLDTAVEVNRRLKQLLATLDAL